MLACDLSYVAMHELRAGMVGRVWILTGRVQIKAGYDLDSLTGQTVGQAADPAEQVDSFDRGGGAFSSRFSHLESCSGFHTQREYYLIKDLL
ncbi:hypothetical protein WI95_00055 [Burkholderia contaminans]|nr:hypothetical protein WI95_00055 [Burkholderia contaminans]